MKKFFSFVAIIGIISVSNCSRIPENNDPVIGIWSSAALVATAQTQKQNSYQEWIFNDAYLGRYHSYIDGNLEIVSDFKWTEEKGEYNIQYPGLDHKSDDIVTLVESENKSILKDTNGIVMAIRE